MLFFALLVTVSSFVFARDCDLIGIIGSSSQVDAAIKDLASYINYNSDNILNPSDFGAETQVTISLAIPMQCSDLQNKAESMEAKYGELEIRVGRSAFLQEKAI